MYAGCFKTKVGIVHHLPGVLHECAHSDHCVCLRVPNITCLQTFDYPSIGAISSFIVETKYPGGLPTAATATVPEAPAAAGPARALVPAAEAAGAVALTGLSLRFAGITSLAELYCHMRDGTEMHTVAPYNRCAVMVAAGLLLCTSWDWLASCSKTSR